MQPGAREIIAGANPNTAKGHTKMDDLDNNDDDQRFRDWAEKVQVRDTEEGAQALREMIQDVRADRATARQAVQEELRAKEIQAEVQDAIAHFNKRYKRVGEDPLLRDAAQTALREEIYSDLKEAGLPEDQISSVRNDLGMVARLHGAARLAGRKVRTPSRSPSCAPSRRRAGRAFR